MRYQTKTANTERETSECLEDFKSLSEELRRAIASVAAHDLAAFEASVRRQLEGAARLQAALLRLGQAACAAKQQVPTRLRGPARELAALNEEYAALLAHSGDSLRLLVSLHGHRQQNRSGYSWQA